MDLGREAERLFTLLVKATERIAEANEALLRLATEEHQIANEAGAPLFCPSCGVENPTLITEGGKGRLAEFLLVATCENCKERILASPSGWALISNDVDEVVKRLEGGK